LNGQAGTFTDGLTSKIDLHLEEFLGEFGVYWRMIEGPRGYLDALAGFRYTYTGTRLGLQANDQAIDTASTELVNRLGQQVAELEPVNALADRSPGFVWRLQTEDGDATTIRPYDDELILINLSLWETIEALKSFVYRTQHVQIMRQREKWFERLEAFYVALWWTPAPPTVAEAKARLDYLREHGESSFAFSFKKTFLPPTDA
jgi:hypothetical protein